MECGEPMAVIDRAPSAPELCSMGALELAAKLRAGEVSSRELAEAHLARIEQVNPALNALRLVLADQALAAADEADRRRVAGEELGPLGGVPVTVKENLDVAGTPTTMGLIALAEAIAPDDAPAVAGLRAAGAIPIGRSNLPDMALRLHTRSGIAGATVNPWGPDRTPGGSSGGEAAALATGMSPLGIGTDLGGSLRWPAQCCGVAAIKPSFGRVAHASSLGLGDFPMSAQLMAVPGPMARKVADLRVALEAMSAPTPRDPWQVPAPLRGPDAPSVVTVVSDPLGDGVDPGIAAGVWRAADALADAGYAVEEGEPPALREAMELYLGLLLGDVERMMPALEPLIDAEAMQVLSRTLAELPPPDDAGWAQMWIKRLRVARAWSEFLAKRTLVLGPVATECPFPPAADLSDEWPPTRILTAMRLVIPANLLGLPAAAVPVGVEDGVPQAVQIVGPRLREDLCLNAAEAIENRYPPITPIDPQSR
jgi:amidase